MSVQHSSNQQSRERRVPPSDRGPLTLTSISQDLFFSPMLAIHEAIASRRAAGREMLHLGFGVISFSPHSLLKAARAETASHAGDAPVAGNLALRQAITSYLTSKCLVPFMSDRIMVGPERNALLYTLLQMPDGDVLLPLSSWFSYAPLAHLARKYIIGVQTDPRDHRRLSPDGLFWAMNQVYQEGTHLRTLLVRSPHRPTGSMFDQATLEALVCWARNNGITRISDDIDGVQHRFLRAEPQGSVGWDVQCTSAVFHCFPSIHSLTLILYYTCRTPLICFFQRQTHRKKKLNDQKKARQRAEGSLSCTNPGKRGGRIFSATKASRLERFLRSTAPKHLASVWLRTGERIGTLLEARLG
ncbi:MAG: aminotransferase class I/II-fold pyridoxal phosphate-dependent enzyme, partial [Ktedonobacteraceae bacterium]|nr:aminotransferase class I/II-fold pyridoxal phosphate-dependent enzyme [Ktedonobacteraceae bacterium]